MTIMKPDNKLMWVLERVLDYVGQGEIIRSWRTKKLEKLDLEKHKSEVKRFIKEVLKRVYIEHKITEKSRMEIYDLALKANLPKFNKSEREMIRLIIILWLSKEVEKIRELEEIQEIIKRSVEFMGLENLNSDETKKFLRLYHNFKEDKLNSDEIFKINQEPNFEYLARDFFDNYYKKGLITIVTRKKSSGNNIDEMNRTLLMIINQGKLNAYGLSKESLEKVKREFDKKEKFSNTYLILGNKINPQVKAKINEHPRLGGFIAHSKIPLLENHIIVGYIVKTKSHFNSPEEFSKLIFENLQENEKENIIAIFEINTKRHHINTYPKGAKFKSKNLDKCYKIINHIKGKNSEERALWALLSKVNIRFSEILPLLPFTILTDNLEESERIFLVKNYPSIKEELGVKVLQDWSEKESSGIAKAIEKQGIPDYNAEEKEIIFGKNPSKLDIKKRFQELAKQIIKNARKYDWLKDPNFITSPTTDQA